jgi:hypothetical protein
VACLYVFIRSTCKTYESSRFLLGGELVLVWGWFGPKVGRFWERSGLGLSEKGSSFKRVLGQFWEPLHAEKVVI